MYCMYCRDRPKTDFPFTAENETGVENGSSFSAVNENENENLLLFSTENETENETDEKYSQPTVEVNLWSSAAHKMLCEHEFINIVH